MIFTLISVYAKKILLLIGAESSEPVFLVFVCFIISFFLFFVIVLLCDAYLNRVCLRLTERMHKEFAEEDSHKLCWTLVHGNL